ncbi:MAG: lipopolysaccharide biosynthesis protein [Planctomycetales bacterium]|nr:lipopolysaccharide biosynthesis protein [Planctomycetales bacterium]
MSSGLQSVSVPPPADSVGLSPWRRCLGVARDIRHRPLVAKVAPSVFDQAMVSGTSFATSIVLGRLCTPEDVGIYFLALSVAMFLVTTQGELISGPYTVFCHGRDEQSLSTYRGSVLVHQFVLTALCIAAVAIACLILAMGYGPQALAPTAIVLLWVIPLMLLRAFVRRTTLAHLRMKVLLRFDAVVSCTQLLGFALLFWFDLMTVPGVLTTISAACGLGCLQWWVSGQFPFRISLLQSWADWRSNWRLARWSLASEFLGSTTPYLLPWMLAAAHGTAATGLLAVCTTLVGLSNCFLLGVSNFLIPRAAAAFAEEGVEALRQIVVKSLLLVVGALGGLCLVFCLAGEWLASAIYGTEYAGSGPVISVLAFSLLGTGVGTVLGNGLYAMRQQRFNLLADAFILVVTLAGAWLLIEPYGALGTAIASLAGVVAGTIVRCLSIQQLLRSLQAEAAMAGGNT